MCNEDVNGSYETIAYASYWFEVYLVATDLVAAKTRTNVLLANFAIISFVAIQLELLNHNIPAKYNTQNLFLFQEADNCIHCYYNR